MRISKLWTMAMTDIGWNLYFAEHDHDVNSKPPAPAINSS
jgi:hypothetical protein